MCVLRTCVSPVAEESSSGAPEGGGREEEGRGGVKKTNRHGNCRRYFLSFSPTKCHVRSSSRSSKLPSQQKIKKK